MSLAALLARAKAQVAAVVIDDFAINARVERVGLGLEPLFGDVVGHEGDEVVWVDDAGCQHFSKRDVLRRVR